jgi:biotin operon repressor
MAAAKTIDQPDSEQILAAVARRPCSLDDICQSMGLARDEVEKNLAFLEKTGLVISQRTEGQLFYSLKN